MGHSGRASKWVLPLATAALLGSSLYLPARRWYLSRYGAKIPVTIEGVSCSARKCYADFLYRSPTEGTIIKASTLVAGRHPQPKKGWAFYVPAGGGLFTGVELADDGGVAWFQVYLALGAIALIFAFWRASRAGGSRREAVTIPSNSFK
ncbi:MAG: hypothetical protein HY549_11015 [Elusimicrobia bacterium]|nr:hypothetical protein [Elusimicrobiota bacterium]